MLAPAYDQYSMPAPEPAYYNPILDSVLSPAFLYDAFYTDANYIPADPQPTANNDTMASQFASFSWSSAPRSGPALVQHSPPPPTHRSAVLAPLENAPLASDRPTPDYQRLSDAPPPDSAVAIPRLPEWDWEAAILQWWPELADGDDATPGTGLPQRMLCCLWSHESCLSILCTVSEAEIDEQAQLAFVQQMCDGCEFMIAQRSGCID
ncbi:hypothetical protein HYPSUDRAFT_895378 [Hypholoma sublateritium FD-334 SS-4]|uniref:Uncharacterized protein n=1 Tax=Hypholoma sublateritium (strain FD-334 SS-4) TaxID=945553 RepID=A0A0D2NKA2_HYPSF|nr:hypothetical protein HYPSUDRAFT_895378 [Hypholoma sublateritium FD-334 SS-4]